MCSSDLATSRAARARMLSADDDGDGLTNGEERTLGTNPDDRDSDGDGVSDPLEVADGTDPVNPNSFRALRKGLVAYYPLDGNTQDKSGYGNHAVNHGAVPCADRLGQANRAYRFDGQSSYLEAPHRGYLNTLPMSTEIGRAHV